mmetsp:Transcript_28712/g.86190  ORF Transcript_28712/g.86190 Transcript_28712/m.86190 type:complete len:200 (+) Transcript_28712:120-719(+)
MELAVEGIPMERPVVVAEERKVLDCGDGGVASFRAVSARPTVELTVVKVECHLGVGVNISRAKSCVTLHNVGGIEVGPIVRKNTRVVIPCPRRRVVHLDRAKPNVVEKTAGIHGKVWCCRRRPKVLPRLCKLACAPLGSGRVKDIDGGCVAFDTPDHCGPRTARRRRRRLLGDFPAGNQEFGACTHGLGLFAGLRQRGG